MNASMEHSPVQAAIPMRRKRLTTEDYESSVWPTLARFFSRFMGCDAPPSAQMVTQADRCSLAELYTEVYKCCCFGLTRRLLDDFFGACSKHFCAVADVLQAASVDPPSFVALFTSHVVSMAALADHLPQIFQYLDRDFMVPKRATTVGDAFRAQFDACVMARGGNGETLFAILRASAVGVINIDMQTTTACVQGLYRIDKSYASYAPTLFARIIPASVDGSRSQTTAHVTHGTPPAAAAVPLRDVIKARMRASALAHGNRKRRPSSPDVPNERAGPRSRMDENDTNSNDNDYDYEYSAVLIGGAHLHSGAHGDNGEDPVDASAEVAEFVDAHAVLGGGEAMDET